MAYSIMILTLALFALGTFTPAMTKAIEDVAVVERTSIRQCKYLYCGYIGDPHLLPFFQPGNQYYCQTPGWELLLSNQYVSIYVLVSPEPYNILDYMIVFPGPPSCSNFASASNPVPCSGSAPGPVMTLVDTNSIIHIHQEQCLTIKIVKGRSSFHFHIWQSPSLSRESCGVCVNWNCKGVSKWLQVQPHPTIKELCNIFLGAARNNQVGTVNNTTIEIARRLCINDLQESFETQAALPFIDLVLQDFLRDKTFEDGLKASLDEIGQAQQKARIAAVEDANELIRSAKPVCNENRKCLEPLVLD